MSYCIVLVSETAEVEKKIETTRVYTEKMTWRTGGDFEGFESLVKKFVGR